MGIPSKLHGKIRVPLGSHYLLRCPNCHRSIVYAKIRVNRETKKINLKCPSCGYLFVSRVPSVKNNNNQQSIQRTIVGILIDDKIKNNNKVYFCLLSALLIYIVFVLLTYITFSFAPIVIILFLMASLYTNQKILEYRIRKGYYGTSEYEAREIIQFILDHAEKTDFIDGDGIKKLMPDPESALDSVSIPEGGVIA